MYTLININYSIIYRIILYSLFSCYFSIIPAQSQPVWEKGYLPVLNFSPKEYNSAPQNWSIAQDQRGIMYFGNNSNVLEYDGETWNTILLKDDNVGTSICSDKTGRIYVGSVNDFGFLVPDSVGTINYVSLRNYLREEQEDFGQVWSTFSVNEEIYFHASSYLFVWDGEKVKTWDLESEFDKSFYVNNSLLFENRSGVFKFNDGKLKLFIDRILYNNERINGISEVDDHHLSINTSKSGMFLVYSNKDYSKVSITPVATELDQFHIVGGKVYKLRENNFSVSAWGEGAHVFDRVGKIVQVINKNSGLQDAMINTQFLDRSANLWLALSNGITSVKINSPLTFFSENTKLEGTIEDITRCYGNIYVGTQTGLYVLQSKGKLNNVISANRLQPVFESINNEFSVWCLLNYVYKKDSLLLASLDDGVYQVNKNGTKQQLLKGTPYDLYQSQYDPHRVYVGLEDGVTSLYRNGNEWVEEESLTGIEGTIFQITEDTNGNLWLGTLSNGLYFVLNPQYKNHKVKRLDYSVYTNSHGIPNGSVAILLRENSPLIGTGKGLYQYNDSLKKFIPDDELNLLFPPNTSFHRINSDEEGNIWVVAYNETNPRKYIGYITKKEGKYTFITASFAQLSEGIIHSIHHDPDGISWLGGPDGLYRYDKKLEPDSFPSFTTQVRKVTLGEDSVIFWGAHRAKDGSVSLSQNEEEIHQLPYRNNSLTFEFAGQSYEVRGTKKYSWFLEGYDKVWVNWKSETKAIYTNLPEGDYVFRVKCKNMYGIESSEATYTFSIFPPWYRTVWAYIFYVFAFGGILYGGIKLNSRRLEKEKIVLEQIVTERTAEIVYQKEEIEEKSKEILDSINYAQKIQRAILPQDENADKILPEHFIYFKPKDIVSGDFYWIAEKENKVFFTVADCTGHGVPGAFMSMIGTSLLNEVVNEKNVKTPADILDEVKAGIIKSLKQSETGESKDGMDAALCGLNKDTNVLEFAGGNNPVYIVREGGNPLINDKSELLNIEVNVENENTKLYEIKGDKMPVAYYPSAQDHFTNHSLLLQSGDIIYLASDGYADQFGGPKGKKFKYKTLKELLISLYNKPMSEQQMILNRTIENWMAHADPTGEKNSHDQIDDICIIGVRIA